MRVVMTFLLVVLVAMVEVSCGGQPQDSVCVPPRPHLDLLEPQSVKVHSLNVLLTVRGSNFILTSVVFFDGHATATTFISSQQLRAIVPLESLHRVGDVPVDVFNPVDTLNCDSIAKGLSQVSNSVTFTVLP